MRWYVLGLLVCVASSARADAEADALTHLNDGVAHYRRDELEAARADFTRARDLLPQRANPHRWLGLTEARLDHCTEAIEELDAFLMSVPPRDARVAEAVAIRDVCRTKLSPSVVAVAPIAAAPATVLPLAAAPIAVAPIARRRPRYWIAGAVIGDVALVGLSVGLGVGLTRPERVHAYPSVGATP